VEGRKIAEKILENIHLIREYDEVKP